MACKISTREARELSTTILILTLVKWILADLVPSNEAQYQSRERELELNLNQHSRLNNHCRYFKKSNFAKSINMNNYLWEIIHNKF